MSATISPTATPGSPTSSVGADDAAVPGRPVAAILGAAMGNQLGAAIGALAFPVLGPSGVVAVRQVVAASVLLPWSRPRIRTLGVQDWVLVTSLALVMAIMNLALYRSVERVGLGMAVTLEFLGPLGVAVLGSRRLRDIGAGLAAILGIVLLVDPDPTTDVLGIALGLLAAACWAGYILLNRRIGQRFTGLDATALACGIAAVLYLPVLAQTLVESGWVPLALGAAVLTGILASVVPYVVDLRALRLLPRSTFSVLMSLHPAFAALAGLVVLRQDLAIGQWLGLGIVVAANIVAVRRPGQPRRRTSTPA